MIDAMRKYWPLNLVAAVFVALGATSLIIFNLPQNGLLEVIACGLVFSNAFMFGAFLVSALFCRYKARHGQRFSYLFIFIVAILATILTMLAGCLTLDGSRVFSGGYWIGNWPTIRRWLIFWPWGFFVSFFVVWGVVVYCKKHETRRA